MAAARGDRPFPPRNELLPRAPVFSVSTTPRSERMDPLIACPECDTLQREIPLPRGGRAECCHCGETLYRSARAGLSHSVALGLAAMVLFLIANALPIAALDLGPTGYSQTTLFGTVKAVQEQG